MSANNNRIDQVPLRMSTNVTVDRQTLLGKAFG